MSLSPAHRSARGFSKKIGTRRTSLFGSLGRAALREPQGPALVVSEGLQTQQSALLGRTSKRAGPLEQTRILPAARPHRPTARLFLPPLRTPIVSPLPVFPQTDRPAGPPSPRAQPPPPARALSTCALPCGDSIRWEGRLPPRSPHTAAASRRTPHAAATPRGASDFAKRLECPSLLAPSKSPTAPGNLRRHCRLPQTTGWVAHPTTLPIRGPGFTAARWERFHGGPGSTRAKGRRGRRPSIGRGGTDPAMPEGVEVLPPLGGTGGCKLSRGPRDAYRRPGSTPARNSQQQQGTGLAALPRLPAAPPTSRCVWSAPACWRCRRATRRPQTDRPKTALHKRQDFLEIRCAQKVKCAVATRRSSVFEEVGRPGVRDEQTSALIAPEGVQTQ